MMIDTYVGVPLTPGSTLGDLIAGLQGLAAPQDAEITREVGPDGLLLFTVRPVEAESEAPLWGFAKWLASVAPPAPAPSEPPIEPTTAVAPEPSEEAPPLEPQEPQKPPVEDPAPPSASPPPSEPPELADADAAAIPQWLTGKTKPGKAGKQSESPPRAATLRPGVGSPPRAATQPPATCEVCSTSLPPTRKSFCARCAPKTTTLLPQPAIYNLAKRDRAAAVERLKRALEDPVGRASDPLDPPGDSATPNGAPPAAQPPPQLIYAVTSGGRTLHCRDEAYSTTTTCGIPLDRTWQLRVVDDPALVTCPSCRSSAIVLR